jgi:hypothetical protein
MVHHDRTSTDDCSLANRDAGQYAGLKADPDVSTNPHRVRCLRTLEVPFGAE